MPIAGTPASGSIHLPPYSGHGSQNADGHHNMPIQLLTLGFRSHNSHGA
jgi:hypothetical protein